MKKTINVNLNGRVFAIDEDAYQLLENYFHNLRIHFRKEEGAEEIVADFEARIEELFSEKIREGYSVISITQVEEVIARVGKPADFSENKGDSEDKQAEKQTNEEECKEKKKKFFRNPDDKIIAGICSGISIYFDWNVLAVRIVFFILLLATSFWMLPIYLLLWILSPEALTVEQRLQMHGEPITVENIGKTLAAGIENLQNKASNRSVVESFLSFIGRCLKACFVGLGCLIGFPLCFAIILTIIVLLSVLLGLGGGLIAWLPFTLSGATSLLNVAHPVPAAITFIILLIIPLMAIVYGTFAYFNQPKPLHRGIKWAIFLIWIVMLIVFLCSGFRVNREGIQDITFGHRIFDPIIYGNGIYTENEYHTKSVNCISVDDDLIARLQIEQIDEGDTASILITGDENLVDKIKHKINDNRLYLSIWGRYRFSSNNNLIITIKTPSLKEIKSEAGGNISINKLFLTKELKIEMEGAGTFDADSLIVRKLTVDLDGIGSIRLAGHAEKANFKMSGAGEINAWELISQETVARLHGIGTIRCNPVESLEAELQGIGKIFYKSEPKRKRTIIRGIGKIGIE
jgi:phage shock protein PspC (stress-responsive transcriptional regulator)